MTQSPRLDRRASIALSVAFAYAVCASVAYPLGIRLLPWIYLPALLTVALPLAFAASLLAGARIYTFRPGRLATFARFCLVLQALRPRPAPRFVRHHRDPRLADRRGAERTLMRYLAPLLRRRKTR